MIFVIFTAAVFILITYHYIYKSIYPRRQLPVGTKESSLEKGWPILGILPSIKKPLCHYLMKLGEKHGPLFRVKFGMRDIIVLNSNDIMKKCLKEDGDNFSGRWDGKIIEIAVKNSGIIMIDGKKWALHRSFMLKVLKDFGFGKSRTTEIVQEECRHFLNELETIKETSFDFSKIISVYTANVISKFIMNKRYERTNEDFKFITGLVNKFTKQDDKTQMFLFMFPFWDKSKLLSKLVAFISPRRKEMNHVYEIFQTEINDHKKRLDINSEGDDLVDRFLIEQSKINSKTGTNQSFTDFQLIRSSFELFMAGYETTSTTLGWALLFLSKYPDTQKKMHDEIVDFIGKDRMPSNNDKKSLPLTQAMMDEILRLSSVAPLAVIHRNFRDTVIDGVFIPKDTFIFPNLYSCHRDPQVWLKPFEFYPEHFLIKTEEGNIKYNPREELIPFGIGKRQCLGESLARAEYFIFLTSIIQRYNVRFATDISEEEYQQAILGNAGTIRFSKVKDFIFEEYE